MEKTHTSETKQHLDEVPWFGDGDALCELLRSIEERLETNNPAAKIEFTVEMREKSVSRKVSLHDVRKYATSRVRVVTAEGRMTADKQLRAITLTFDERGLRAVVSSSDTDWIDSAIACIQREARKRQSRWFAHNSVRVRWFGVVMGVADAIIVGVLISSAVRHTVGATPQTLIGLAAFLGTAALLVAGALRMRLFEIVTGNQEPLYLYLLRLLVIGLFFGILGELLVNLAT